MDIVGHRKFVEVPGEKTHELPPLLVRTTPNVRRLDRVVGMADEYLRFIAQWQWGDSILEWIRQCEITFGARLELRNLLRPDVWPHAGRSSFVMLLEDKAVPTEGVEFEKAVGMRLTFRQPPAPS